MTDQEKMLRTVNEVRNKVLFWGFYLVLSSIALLLLIFGKTIDMTDDRILSLYWFVGNLIILTLIIFIYNLLLFKNPSKIRSLAIKKYDEMNYKQNQITNSLTLRFLLLIAIVLLIISIPINQISLFGYSLVTIITIMLLKFITTLIYRIKR